jgi:dsRNA-specific ribonuclease
MIGEKVVGKGKGASKRTAEQVAAQTALDDFAKDI